MSSTVSLKTDRITRTPLMVVTVDGKPQYALNVNTQHGVDRDKGTATVSLINPGTSISNLKAAWLNRPIEVQVGYLETGGAKRVFAGRITSIDRGFSDRGYTLQVKATGWSSLLDFESEEDIVFAGNTKLYDIVRALCRMRGLPMYGGELIRYPTSNTDVRLGGVADVDGGKVIIPRRTSPLQWITQKLELFGYRAFDRPDGMYWWQRVNGASTKAAVQTFTQGLTLLSASRSDDIDGMVTWWDVEGASWTDSDGIPIKIRSFPAAIPPDTGGYITPPGFVRRPLSDPSLVTQALADAVRNSRELDTLGPYESETWRWLGEPTIQPGDTVALTSPLLQLTNAKRWVMSVDHSASAQGIRTTWQGWTGVGTALAGGDDSEEITVFTGYRHVGDEYLPNYGQPTPQGREISFDVTVPDSFTAMYLEGSIRGSNSYLMGGPLIDATVSKIEAWQGGDKALGSATLPSVSETVGTMQPFRLPIPGRLEPGVATIKLISGEDRGGGPDDFEVLNLKLILTGRGSPALPNGGS